MTYQKQQIFIKRLLVALLPTIIISIYFTFYLSFVLCLLGIVLYFYLKQIKTIKETTLCLIVQNEKVLMMYRNKKKNDVHLNKYNGLGGRVEEGESSTQCILREVHEEAGIHLTKYRYVGKIKFKNFGYQKGTEVMYCFHGFDYENEIGECNEGELVWIPKGEVLNLPLWEGDQYFIMHIINNVSFSGFIHYQGDEVIDYQMKLKRGDQNRYHT